MGYGKETWKALALLGEMGFVISLPLLAMIPFGIFLDNRYSAKPIFLLICIAISFALSIFLVYKRVRSLRVDVKDR